MPKMLPRGFEHSQATWNLLLDPTNCTRWLYRKSLSKE